MNSGNSECSNSPTKSLSVMIVVCKLGYDCTTHYCQPAMSIRFLMRFFSYNARKDSFRNNCMIREFYFVKRLCFRNVRSVTNPGSLVIQKIVLGNGTSAEAFGLRSTEDEFRVSENSWKLYFY